MGVRLPKLENALALREPPRYRTKVEIAYNALKEAILTGSCPPGTPLVLRTVARELGMSEIPVREAFQRLDREGLISIAPHVSVRVSDFPMEGVIENLLIRRELEGLAAELAAKHITDDVLNQLEAQLVKMEACLHSGDFAKFEPLNRNFHLTMYGVIPYSRLYRLIEETWNQVPQTRSAFVLVPKHAVVAHEEHKLIVEALRNRDGTEARHLVRRQKLRAVEAIRRAHRGGALR